MENNKVTEYDCETGETIVRDMNKDELAQYEKDQNRFIKMQEDLLKKEQLRKNAEAKLIALGLTKDDLEALLA